MRLVSGADGEGGGVDHQELIIVQPAANGALDAVARQQGGAAVKVAVWAVCSAAPWAADSAVAAASVMSSAD